MTEVRGGVGTTSVPHQHVVVFGKEKETVSEIKPVPESQWVDCGIGYIDEYGIYRLSSGRYYGCQTVITITALVVTSVVTLLRQLT